MRSVIVEGVSKDFSGVVDDGSVVTAVSEVDLQLDEGTALAVVGPNGAGKSTLLRLIAGITAPTRGSIRRSRRCASLIELSSGFHPDLSASENLELGLALAGLSRARRRRVRPDVIEFAGLGSNIDLPVRHLSSGLLGRLSCSIAVHSEPELLLVDEVLAVGDASFQRQMLTEVARLVDGGTTLMLVTHSLELAALATSRTVWMSEGGVVADGPTGVVLDRYEEHVRGRGRVFEGRSAHIDRARVTPDRIDPRHACTVEVDITCSSDDATLSLRLELRPEIGAAESWMRRADESPKERELNLVAFTESPPLRGLAAGPHHLQLHMPSVPITESRLEVAVLLVDPSGRIHDEAVCELQIGTNPLRPYFHLQAR